MIRAVTIEEVHKFAELGRWFHDRMEMPGKFNCEVFVENWTRFINLNIGFILGRFDEDQPQEAIGSIIYPDVNGGELTAQSVFWFYLEEPKGLEAGMLHEAWECVCKAKGAKELGRSAICNERLAKVGGFLLKSGYQLTSMQYTKRL